MCFPKIIIKIKIFDNIIYKKEGNIISDLKDDKEYQIRSQKKF